MQTFIFLRLLKSNILLCPRLNSHCHHKYYIINMSHTNIMMVTVKLLVRLLLVTSMLVLSFHDKLVFGGAPSRGSCTAARKCCDGKDPNCVVQNGNKNAASLNSILQNDNIEDGFSDIDLDDLMPCYCDHGCMSVGDCCSDFKEYCGVIDCQVSDWSDWSKCDVACGIGTSTRTREVLRPESNGGRQCPSLEESRSCRATRCSTRQLDKISALKETAMLLPGKYASKFAQSRGKYDVRSNLKSYRQREGKQYCVMFKVEKAMKSCLRDKDTKALQRGNIVCSMCNSKAQRTHLGGRCGGHGAEGKRTRFKNVLSPRCHGKWTRMEIVEGECPCRGGPNFIFV